MYSGFHITYIYRVQDYGIHVSGAMLHDMYVIRVPRYYKRAPQYACIGCQITLYIGCQNGLYIISIGCHITIYTGWHITYISRVQDYGIHISGAMLHATIISICNLPVQIGSAYHVAHRSTTGAQEFPLFKPGARLQVATSGAALQVIRVYIRSQLCRPCCGLSFRALAEILLKD